MAASPVLPSSSLPFRGVQNNTTAYLPLDPSLNEIRYLRLHPGLPDEPITCSLGYSSFQKHDSGHVAYQALSYCWGEASDTTPIRLYCPVAKNASPDRLDTDHTLIQYHVTQNLKAALRSLRLFAKPRTLWIDAVCMNQSDPKEKTHQVGLMNLIYSSAEEVIVWLGEQDLDSKIITRCHEILGQSIVDCLPLFDYQPRRDLPEYIARLQKGDCIRLRNRFLARSRADSQLQSNFRSQTRANEDAVLSYLHGNQGGLTQQKIDLSTHSLDTRFRTSLERLLSRPYFRRIWVYQEVLLAPLTEEGHRKVTIRIGRSSLGWGDLINIVRLFAPIRKSSSSRNEPKQENTRWFEEAWSHMGRLDQAKFEMYYARTLGFEATDARDKLFALLHLGYNTRSVVRTNPLLSPDYEIPLEQVLLNFIRAGLDLPLFVKVGKDSTSLPWLPVVAESHGPSPLLRFGFWHDVQIARTRNWQIPDNPRPVNSNSLLPSIGRAISQVAEILADFGSLRSYADPRLPFAERLSTFLVQMIQACHPFVRRDNDQQIVSGFLRMLKRPEQEIVATQGVFSTLQFPFFTRVIAPPNAKDLQALERFFDNWLSSTNSQLFVTSNREIALSRAGVLPEDLIAELPGNTTPVVMTAAQNQSARPLWQIGPDYKIVPCTFYDHHDMLISYYGLTPLVSPPAFDSMERINCCGQNSTLVTLQP